MKKNEIIILSGLLICFLISMSFILLYKHDNGRLTNLGTVSDYNTTNDYIVIIDDYVIDASYLSIYGCALKLGKNIDYVNNQFVLIDDNDRIYGLNTIVVDRPSATEYYNDGFNYDKSGLQAHCKIGHLVDNENYKIGLIITEYDRSNYLVVTDKVVGGQY